MFILVCIICVCYFRVTHIYLHPIILLVCIFTDFYFYIFYIVYFSRSRFRLPSGGILLGKLMFPLGPLGLSLPFPEPDVPFLLSYFSKLPFHGWEKNPYFNPTKVSANCPRWVNYHRSPLTGAQEMADNAHVTQKFVSSVIAREAFADASLLGSPSDLSFSYDLAAPSSTTLLMDLNRLKDFRFSFPRSYFLFS